MQIVIAGAGKYGHTLAGELVAEGHDVTIIEKNEEWFEDIMEEFDLSGVIGNAASYATQLEAGVGECDAFMAMTGYRPRLQSRLQPPHARFQAEPGH